MSVLTDKKLWMLILLVAILGIVGLAAFAVDVPKVLNDIVYFVLGGGVAGSVAGTAKVKE